MVHALMLAALSAATAPAALAVDFEGLKSEGQVMYAVYADAGAWSRRKGEVAGGALPVQAGAAHLRLALPPGRYAVMAFHDRNSDGRLNLLPIGLPIEPYGFSNDSRGTFGPPSWRAAVFTVPAQGARQLIHLR